MHVVLSHCQPLGLGQELMDFGSGITFHSFEAALDCSCQPAAYHWGFSRFYQPKHCFSPRRTGVPVICIHISIWAVPLLLLLLTHQQGAAFSFAETGRFGLINVITRMWFCIHAQRCTLIVTLPVILSRLEIRHSTCYMTQLWLSIPS